MKTRFKVGDVVKDKVTSLQGTIQTVLDEGYEVLLGRPSQLWYLSHKSVEPIKANRNLGTAKSTNSPKN